MKFPNGPNGSIVRSSSEGIDGSGPILKLVKGSGAKGRKKGLSMTPPGSAMSMPVGDDMNPDAEVKLKVVPANKPVPVKV